MYHMQLSKCSKCELSLIQLNHDSDTELLCACICTLGHLALDSLAGAYPL